MRETTLTANRGLRAFTAAGGRRRFRVDDTPQCFKDDAKDCGEGGGADAARRRAPEERCGPAEAVDVAGLDCRHGTLAVCVDTMDVRTFVLGVSRASA